LLIKHTFEGSLTKKPVTLQFRESSRVGIFFEFADGSQIEASSQNVLSATRNTVLGNADNRLCFVEHLLAVINLLGINNIQIVVDAPEIPLADGSGQVWLKLLKDWPSKQAPEPSILLNEPLCVSDNERALLAYPNEQFKLTYLFQSPVDGSQFWTTWSLPDGIEKLAKARTFGSAAEHQMLGLKGKVLSYDQNGFDLPLYWPDEPALHKLLDLFGDLSLCGINPLKLKAHFVSLKGGHALNTKMAALLSQKLQLAPAAG
jgi:UDP-3-O-[3-hydroxymyristoyl] N-acetylglucosamine deacetylase